jgi:hypothetical protein
LPAYHTGDLRIDAAGTGTRVGLTEQVVEKDYALGWLW